MFYIYTSFCDLGWEKDFSLNLLFCCRSLTIDSVVSGTFEYNDLSNDVYRQLVAF